MTKLTVFSQTNTDSLHVRCFTKEEVLTIIKDIKSGDLAKKELELTNKEIVELDSIITKKDSIISTYETKKLSYEEAIKSEGERFKIIDDKLKKIEENLKTSKTTNKIVTIGGIGIIGFLLGVLIVK